MTDTRTESFLRSRIVATFCFANLLFATALHSQSITTRAGGGSTAVEGLPATSVILSSVRGLAVDAGGNVYISDQDTNTVYRVSIADGTIATYAGNGGGTFSGDGGPAKQAGLKGPSGISFDNAGNLYIADHDNGRVRRVAAGTGIITTVAGGGPEGGSDGDNGPATSAFLRGPTAVAWHQGSLYIADDGYAENNVRRVDAQGTITTYAGTGDSGFSGDGGPAKDAVFNSPLGIALDQAGNLYIADAANNRVRRVDAVTKVVTTVIGGGSPSDGRGDGGQGTDADLEYPTSLAFDAAGKLYVTDHQSYGLVRRYDPATKIVDTVAGNGTYGGGDGQIAKEAGLYAPFAIAFDSAQNLYVHDGANGTVRRVNATTRIIQTFAGGGTFIGDGLVATSAILQSPLGIALDRNGNLLIADTSHSLVRKVNAVSGVISTFAGVLNQCCGAPVVPGAAATETTIGFPTDIAVDAGGNAYVADPYGGRVLRVDAEGKITVYAGGGTPADETGDNGPATAARIIPLALAFDSAGNLYLVDHAYDGPHRIRRVDAQTKQITTVAGGKVAGFAGDGAAATSALLDTPQGIAVDRAGNLFIADGGNSAIRRIDALTGNITTYAGRGNPADGVGDGQLATAAGLDPKHMTIDRRNDDLYVADLNGSRVRKIDASTKVITTIAGSGSADFSGDNGAAVAAKLNLGFELSGVLVDGAGRVYVSDSKNNRIRVVNACAPVSAASLVEPSDGATTSTAPRLAWQNAAAAGDPALRFDVYVSTDGAANTLFATDLTSLSATLSNLRSGTKYFWRVVTRGDRFCPTVSTATSPIRSFTTASGCDVPASFNLLSPDDNGSVQAPSTQLSWAAAAGAGSYEVLLGTTNPPPLAASTTATSFTATGLTPGTTYYWSVVARGSCDRDKKTAAPVRTFRTSGSCPAPAAFTLTTPGSGATGVSVDTTLEWSDSANATSYDLYFGTSAEPPVFLLGLTTNRVRVSGLTPGAKYFWRVIANIACDATRRFTTPVSSFTVRGACRAAGGTTFAFTPSGTIAVGQTYVVTWNAADDLDGDGYYIVERSLTSSFAPIADTQTTAGTSASFVAGSAGTIYHRVRAFNPCGGSSISSPARAVTVIAAPPNVTFTVQPQAIVTALGEKLEEKRGRFVLENIGAERVSVLIGRQEVDSVPFFTIHDPLGGDSSIIELEPRQPKEMELRFSGPPNNVAGSYQGIVFLASLGKSLAITPYAFVNLRVGGGDTAVPQFRVNGTPAGYAFFPGFSGDDSARPAINVEIHNPGTTPMELGSEIGPELWLVPESGWNATAIPPGGTRTVRLSTRRNRAPNGSALPRYTYWRVRTRNGQTARLLVQDNDVRPTGAGRGAALDATSRSLIVPEVVSRASGRSILRLSNLGSVVVEAELFFTPQGADGFDASRVKRASITIPANDVVALNDPLVQLWGLSVPAQGQIEVRTDPTRIGLLGVRSEVVTTSNGGEYGSISAVHVRGEGASVGNDHAIVGVSSDARTRPVLILAETSGVDRAMVRITLDDKDGNRKGQKTEDLPRYGVIEIDEIITLLGGAVGNGGRVGIEVTSGGGSVAGVVKLIDRVTGGGALLVSASLQQPATTNVRGIRRDAEDSRSYFLPAVLNSPANGTTPALQSTIGLVAVRGDASFSLTYRDATRVRSATATVVQGRTVHYANVLAELLGVPAGEASEGTLLIETNTSGRIYARLTSPGAGALASISQDLTIIGSDSELVTSSESQRPIFLDGLSQTLDANGGSRWSLWLNELSGRAGSVMVRLYEAGNRTVPFAEKRFQLTPFRTLGLEDLFSSMELTTDDRNKDRANILLSVMHADGAASVAAIARSLDRFSLSTRSFALAPAGTAPLEFAKVSVVAPEPLGVPKRRTVRP